MHVVFDVKLMPPPEYVPGGHAFAGSVATPMPGGQK
jgi:hypothetical protein